MALVSVVTPVYNGERYLKECIESVLAQSFKDYEYVIVDNCSTDKSKSIAEKYAKDKRIKIYQNKKKLSVLDSFNRAASRVSKGTKYIKFLSADDLLFPNCLEDMIKLAEMNKNIKLVGSYKIEGTWVNAEGPPYPEIIISGREVCKNFFKGKFGILGSETNHLIRIENLNLNEELFDKHFEKHSDTELFIRLLKNGSDFGFVHQILTFTRTHQESVTFKEVNRLGTGSLEYLAILLKHGSEFLDEKEHKNLIQTYKKNYNRFLFRIMMKIWEPSICGYHLKRMKELGIKINLTEFILSALLEVLHVIMNPGDNIRSLLNEYRYFREMVT
jgi:glycosyltransferase involved in cell wall biosynthesis